MATRKRLVSLEEPRTMAQVQQLVELTYPKTPYNVWIQQPVRLHPFPRHIAVKFGGEEGTIEAFGATWLEALADIEVMRAELRRRRKGWCELKQSKPAVRKRPVTRKPEPSTEKVLRKEILECFYGPNGPAPDGNPCWGDIETRWDDVQDDDGNWDSYSCDACEGHALCLEGNGYAPYGAWATVKQPDTTTPTEPVTEEVSPPPTCRHCGQPRDGGHYGHGLAFTCKRDTHHNFEPGPTYEQLREQNERLESALTEAVRSEDLERALRRIGRLNKAVHVLYRVFEAAVVLADAWPGSSPNWDALREAIEAYRELVAPLGEQGGAEPEKSTVQP